VHDDGMVACCQTADLSLMYCVSDVSSCPSKAFCTLYIHCKCLIVYQTRDMTGFLCFFRLSSPNSKLIARRNASFGKLSYSENV